MASIHKKTGASGAESPYWQAKFKGLDGRPVWLTTKQKDSRKAQAIADKWQRATELARDWELNQNRTQKILADIQELTKTPATMEVSTRLLNDLMASTIGEQIAGQNFATFCADWIKGKKHTAAGTSVARYQSVIDGFLAYLPEKRRNASVGSISAGEIERYRDSEKDAGKTPTTINFGIKILRGIFSTAVDHGIITANPARAVKLLAQEPDERQPFDESQVKAILAKADDEWRGMILIAYHGGLRLTDCADLTWKAYDPIDHTLSFRAKKTGSRTHKDTTIALHPDIVAYLESLSVSDFPNQKLFPSLAGQLGSQSGLSRKFNKLMEQAGIVAPVGAEKNGKGRRFKVLGFHSLRHSFISRLADLQISADIRKELAGHASDAIHARYVHMDLSHQRAAVGRLPSVI